MCKKAAEWLIPLSCILLQYKTFGGTYGLFLLLILVCVFVFKYGFFRIDRDFLIIGVLISTQQIVSTAVYGMDWERCIENIITIFMVIIAVSIGLYEIDTENVIQNYKKIGLVCALAVIGQTILYLGFNQPISAIMLFPQPEDAMVYWATNTNRACGFFTEPQTYCSYMLPLLIILLNRKEYKFAIFISLSFILTGSSLGIIMVALLWGGMLFKSKVSNKTKVIMIFAILAAIVAFMNLDMFSAAREKINTIFRDFSLYSSIVMTTNHSYSNYLRLIKGWVTLFEMPFGAKILGIGITNLVPYMQKFNINFSWNVQWSVEGVNSTYFTSGAGVLIECGLIVGLLYYLFVFKKIKGSNGAAKTIMLVLLVQSFMSQMFFNGIFRFYFLLYYVLNESKMSTIRVNIRERRKSLPRETNGT